MISMGTGFILSMQPKSNFRKWEKLLFGYINKMNRDPMEAIDANTVIEWFTKDGLNGINSFDCKIFCVGWYE